MSSPRMLNSRIYTVTFVMHIMLVIDKSTNKKKKPVCYTCQQSVVLRSILFKVHVARRVHPAAAAVCSVTSAVRGALSAVCRAASAMRCATAAVHCAISAVCCATSAECSVMSAVCCAMLPVRFAASAVCCAIFLGCLNAGGWSTTGPRRCKTGCAQGK